MERKPRTRQLDKLMVRTLCEKRGIYTLEGFEHEFYKFLIWASKAEDKTESEILKDYQNTPKKAWNGEPVGVTQAKRLADFFGYMGNYGRLQETPPSRWQQLLNSSKSLSFMQPCFESSNLGLFGEQCLMDDKANLRKVEISSIWKLQISYNINESVFIALRSSKETHQLTPVVKSKFSFEEMTKGNYRFPAETWLTFPYNDGLGFREFIAIKSNRIPLHPKSEDDPTRMEQSDLDIFAHALLSQEEPYQIARYPFILVDSFEAVP